MCQRKKLQIKFNKKQQFRVATLLDADKIITFSKERQVAKYIMKHGKIAGQQTLFRFSKQFILFYTFNNLIIIH